MSVKRSTKIHSLLFSQCSNTGESKHAPAPHSLAESLKRQRAHWPETSPSTHYPALKLHAKSHPSRCMLLSNTCSATRTLLAQQPYAIRLPRTLHLLRRCVSEEEGGLGAGGTHAHKEETTGLSPSALSRKDVKEKSSHKLISSVPNSKRKRR